MRAPLGEETIPSFRKGAILPGLLAFLIAGSTDGAADDPDTDPIVRKGIEVMLSGQEGREWPYEGVYRVQDGKRRVIPMGYRVGGTAIACTALLEAPWDGAEGDRREAIERGIEFVLESLDHPLLSAEFLGTYDVRGWGHIYALDLLLRLEPGGRIPKGWEARVSDGIRFCIRALEKTEIPGAGGWHYARPQGALRNSPPSTPMTASALLALYRARAAGFRLDRAVVRRAISALEKARLETGAFQYATDPGGVTGRGFESVAGAAARMPLCEVSLFLAGRGSVGRLRGSLDAFLEHWGHLNARRKQPGTHAPPYMIAPYYFFFAHTYAAEAAEFLPEGEREVYRKRLRELLLKVREPDGSWNDRVFDRSQNFGTAMAVLALTCPQRSRPPAWPRRRLY